MKNKEKNNLSPQRNIAYHGKQNKHGRSRNQHPCEYGPVPDEEQRSQPDERGQQQHVVPQGIQPMAVKQGVQRSGGAAAVAKKTRRFIKKALRQPAGPGRVTRQQEHRARRSQQRQIQEEQFHAMKKACGHYFLRKP